MPDCGQAPGKCAGNIVGCRCFSHAQNEDGGELV